MKSYSYQNFVGKRGNAGPVSRHILYNYCLQMISNRVQKRDLLSSVSVFSKSHQLNFYSFTTQSRLLTTLEKEPFKNTVGTGEMLVTSIFSFSHNVFSRIKEILDHLSHTKIVICKSFEFGLVSFFFVRQMFNSLLHRYSF